MSATEDIFAMEMQLLKEDLIARHIELGMPASNKWVESIEDVTVRLKGRIIGEDYTEQLVNGREPGKFPPIEAIEQWILDKGIDYSDITLSSLAFLIARKISMEGTKYFQQGGTDLIESVITPKRIQRIIDNVSDFYISTFNSEITGVLKKMAV